MSQGQNLCPICAWRITCQKKFSLSGRDMRCPDFSRDVTIKEAEAAGEAADNEKGE